MSRPAFFMGEAAQALRGRSEPGGWQVPSQLIYLNNARMSPCAPEVSRAIEAALEQERTCGWTRDQEHAVMQDARSAIASLINASVSEVALTQSATYAFNTVVNGMVWRNGDNVVMTDLAYRSVAHPLLRLCGEHAVRLRVARSEEFLIDPDRLAHLVDDHTRLVVVPHLPLLCGVPQAVEEISVRLRGTGALFLVNATQSVGQLPVDVQRFGSDFLIGTSRKWLRGPRGLGFLYVREELIPSLRPAQIGYPAARWTDNDGYELSSDIERLRLGDYPYALIAGLAAAARVVSTVGVGRIATHNAALGALCRRGLEQLSGVELYDAAVGVTGTVPCNLRDVDADVAVRRLAEYGIVTCVLYEEDCLLAFRRLGQRKLIRISAHYLNQLSDIEALVSAMDRAAA